MLVKLYRQRQNFRTERFAFHRSVQQPSQSVEDYIAFLKKKSMLCKLESYLEDALTDQIIFGIGDNNLRKRLLSIEDLDLDKAVDIAIQQKSVEQDSFLVSQKLQMSQIHSTEVNVFSRKGSTTKQGN